MPPLRQNHAFARTRGQHHERIRILVAEMFVNGIYGGFLKKS
jgi:hypothetical protein